MGAVTQSYRASSNLTVTNLHSIATSSTWVGGYESATIDNTTNLYLDYIFDGKVTVGTTPTASTEIRIYVVASVDGTTWPDVFDGTSSAETVTSAGVLYGLGRLAAVLTVDSTTSNRAYYCAPFSVAALFGGILPPSYVIFISHNTGVNSNSTTGNHAWSYTRIVATVA